MNPHDNIIYALASLTLESGEPVTFETLRAVTKAHRQEVLEAIHDPMVEPVAGQDGFRYRLSRKGLEFMAKQFLNRFTWQQFGLEEKAEPVVTEKAMLKMLEEAKQAVNAGIKIGAKAEQVGVDIEGKTLDQLEREISDKVFEFGEECREVAREAKNNQAKETWKKGVDINDPDNDDQIANLVSQAIHRDPRRAKTRNAGDGQ